MLEGCAFTRCRDVIDRMAAIGVATDSVLLMGGGLPRAGFAPDSHRCRPPQSRGSGLYRYLASGGGDAAAVAAGLIADSRRQPKAIGGIRHAYLPTLSGMLILMGPPAALSPLFQSLKPFFASTGEGTPSVATMLIGAAHDDSRHHHARIRRYLSRIPMAARIFKLKRAPNARSPAWKAIW